MKRLTFSSGSNLDADILTRIKQLEIEKGVLKRAAALPMTDGNQFHDNRKFLYGLVSKHLFAPGSLATWTIRVRS